MIMKRKIILQSFTGIFLLCCLPFFMKGARKRPAGFSRDELAFIVMPLTDTIPAAAKPTEGTKPGPAIAPNTGKPVATVIKEVPKARKVAVPRPVAIKVKPVKVVKPKIIRPVLKVL